MIDSDPPDEGGARDRDPPPAGSVDFSTYNIPTDLTAFQTHLLCLIRRFGPVEGVTLQNALEDLYPEDINHGGCIQALTEWLTLG